MFFRASSTMHQPQLRWLGISAASTLLTGRLSLAQQPELATTKITAEVQDDDVSKLELTERILVDTVGKDHPKLREVRTRLAHARAWRRSRCGKGRSRRQTRSSTSVESTNFERFTWFCTQRATISPAGWQCDHEEIHGDQSVVVRRSADGNVTSELLAASPKEFRALSMATSPKQNSELQKAIEKYKARMPAIKTRLRPKKKWSRSLASNSTRI